ncbi:hypothetical protein ACFPPA_15990 [Rhodanobacter ginsengisoli]|uniref:Uncharacterized protein n=1 Tax=Rhodanobacter ginsengisoli TaxID=418646 RepID=A0ABW0QSU7_9GAMM
MNDMAYDISHLLEPEMAQLEAPTLRIAKAPPAVPAPSGIVVAQEALARELLAVADVHEELIQQYLRMSGYSPQDGYDA